MSEPVEASINVTSGFGRDTRKPFVQIEVPERLRAPVMRPSPTGPEPAPGVFGVQTSPAEARALALNLLQAAEGALGDGFLLTFLEREIGLSLEELAPLLVKFRGYRTRNEPEGA